MTTTPQLNQYERRALLITARYEREIESIAEPPGWQKSQWAEWARDAIHGPECGAWWFESSDPLASTHVHRAVRKLESLDLVSTWNPWRGRVHVLLTDAGRALAEQLKAEMEGVADG